MEATKDEGYLINMKVDQCFRYNLARINVTIVFVLIVTALLKVVQSVSPVTDSISSKKEIIPVTKQLCGHVEIRDQEEYHNIVNVTEGYGQDISAKDFSVIYNKIKEGANATIVLIDKNCMIEICGYNRFSPNSQRCKEFRESETSLADDPYGQSFQLTHISCGCKKNRPNCEKRTCDYYEFDSASDEVISKWPEGTCGILFQEENCQECNHDGILLTRGETVVIRDSEYIRSSYISLVSCSLWVAYGKPLFGYDYAAKTAEGQVYFKTDYHYLYYCNNCDNGKKGIKKLKNVTSSTTVMPTSTLPLLTIKNSTEANPLLFANYTTGTISNTPDPDQIARSTWYIIGSVTVSLFLLGATCFGLGLGFRKFSKRKPSKDKRTKLLTKKDIVTFKKGEDIISYGNIELTNVFTGITEALKLPYDKKYEIDRNHLVFGDVIKEGTFGIINAGTLLTFDKNRFKKVAIKTPKESREYCKDVLNEIKILSYLGYHPNIVFFIGACTVNLEEGKVHYIMEFGKYGSLFNYLETQKKLINPPTTQRVIPSEKLTGYCVTALFEPERFTKTNQELFNRMVKWSEDIASGMEFLHEKKILHNDLATRNILLGEDLSAKLADFGLSRKLYENLIYEKTGQVPIPINWMAIESLISNTYTFKSDVWAYGVTLWEIFSIGSHPYLDMGFKEICSFLLSGSRLECPLYATQEIYEKILLCWNAESNSRPRFKDLKEFFNRIHNNFHTDVIDD